MEKQGILLQILHYVFEWLEVELHGHAFVFSTDISIDRLHESSCVPLEMWISREKCIEWLVDDELCMFPSCHVGASLFRWWELDTWYLSISISQRRVESIGRYQSPSDLLLREECRYLGHLHSHLVIFAHCRDTIADMIHEISWYIYTIRLYMSEELVEKCCMIGEKKWHSSKKQEKKNLSEGGWIMVYFSGLNFQRII